LVKKEREKIKKKIRINNEKGIQFKFIKTYNTLLKRRTYKLNKNVTLTEYVISF